MDITVGQIIKQKVKDKGISHRSFAVLIGESKANIYKLYNKKDFYAGMLSKISIILEHDFFQYYSTYKTQEMENIHLVRDSATKYGKDDTDIEMSIVINVPGSKRIELLKSIGSADALKLVEALKRK